MAERKSNQPAEKSGDTAAVEHQFHTYEGTRIPWYVRMIWLLFWIFVIYYAVKYLFPDLQVELLNPP